MSKKTPDDIRTGITQLMVDAIKDGVPPWRKPWASSPNIGMPRNFFNKRRYTGINPLILILDGMFNEIESCNWGTSNSWMEHVGAHPQAGSKAAHITLFRMIQKRENGKLLFKENGEKDCFPLLREYAVFNAEQVTAPSVKVILDGKCQSGRSSIVKSLLGSKDKKARTEATTVKELLKIAERHLGKKAKDKLAKKKERAIAQAIHDGIQVKLNSFLVKLEKRNDDPDFSPAEELLKFSGADFKEGTKACYTPAKDTITMPPKRAFDSMADYYETAFHELAHWARGKGRVPDLYEKRVHTYAFEELVAEISACIITMELNVPMADKMMTKSRAYVKHWIKGMGDDPKFIFDASTQAGKVVDFLLGFVGMSNVPHEDTDPQERAA